MLPKAVAADKEVE